MGVSAMSDHDVAGCQQEPCTRRADFNSGWALGKAKFLYETPTAIGTSELSQGVGATTWTP